MNRSMMLSVLLLAAGFSGWAADTLLVLPDQDAALTMSPDSQLAPWKLVAASGENSRIEAAVFELKGLDPALITGVMLASNLGELDSYLLHFPYNRRNQLAKLTVEGQTLRAQFAPPIAVPTVLSRKPGLLLGFALSNRAGGEFSITLKSLTFGADSFEVADGERNVKVVSGVPEAEIAVATVTAPTGVPALQLTVTPREPLAFAPGVALQFPNLKINDFHRWGEPYRALMTPSEDGKSYVFTWPEYALLSDNLLPMAEKKTSYQATPPPNNWRLRPDNTGFDLFDGDARGTHHASPGGIEFVGAEKISLVIDLQREAQIGGVSLYGLFDLGAVAASVAPAADGPWSPAVSMPCPLKPQEQFGKGVGSAAVGLSPALFNLFFPELYRGRYVKLELSGDSRAEGRQIGVTEILVWGLDPARSAQFPLQAVITLTSENGARAEKRLPVRKTNP